MNRTEISWVRNPDGSQGFTSNPVRGQCLHRCSYCYAEKIRRRYKQPAAISWHPEELEVIRRRKKPATIFMGSMHDLFGAWVPHEWLVQIVKTTKECPQHTFLFLTKNPSRYLDYDFPDNCWIGYSDTGTKDERNWVYFKGIRNTFVSCEPLLGYQVNINFSVVKWLIIGSLNQNGEAVHPDRGGTKLEIVRLVLEAADKANVPVFIKPELGAMYSSLPECRALPYLKAAELAK